MNQAISPNSSSGMKSGTVDQFCPPGHWQAKGQLFDYRKAANPVRSGLTEPIGYYQWDPALHSTGPTAILPLDRSESLGCAAPATSPALAAHFLRIMSVSSVAHLPSAHSVRPWLSSEPISSSHRLS